MRRRRVDGLIVRSIHDMAWLTAFEGLFGAGFSGVSLVTSSDAILFTDARFDEQARSEAGPGPWRVVTVKDKVTSSLAREAKRLGIRRPGIDPDVAHSFFVAAERALRLPLKPLPRLVEEARAIKDPGEVDRIAHAAAIADGAFEEALSLIAPGVTERELAFEIEVRMRRAGASGVAFPPIVASGPNSSKPHAQTTDRAFVPGDLIKIDIGAVWDGYCSDMTRMVALGEPGDEQREIHGHVLEANRLAIEAAQPGMTGRDLDAVARVFLEEKGFGRMFGHGLGHGVGIEVHELPWISRRGQEPLLAGEVFTIEPGLYLPGRFGVRIEDLVVLEDEGVRVLSGSPKELLVL